MLTLPSRGHYSLTTRCCSLTIRVRLTHYWVLLTHYSVLLAIGCRSLFAHYWVQLTSGIAPEVDEITAATLL